MLHNQAVEDSHEESHVVIPLLQLFSLLELRLLDVCVEDLGLEVENIPVPSLHSLLIVLWMRKLIGIPGIRSRFTTW